MNERITYMRFAPWIMVALLGGLAAFIIGEFFLGQGGLITAGIFLGILFVIFLVMFLLDSGNKQSTRKTNDQDSQSQH